MKYIVLQREDRIIFEHAEQYYLDLGYPGAVANQYAWDCYFASKRGVHVA